MQLLVSASLTACNHHKERSNYSNNCRDNLKQEINLPLTFLSVWLLPLSEIPWFDKQVQPHFSGCQNSAPEYRWHITNPKRAHVSLTEKTQDLWFNSSCEKRDLTQQCEQLWNMKEKSRRYRWQPNSQGQRLGTWAWEAPASVTATPASRLGGYMKDRVPGCPWVSMSRLCVHTRVGSSPAPPQISAASSSEGSPGQAPTHLYYLLKEELLTDIEALGFRLKVSYLPCEKKSLKGRLQSYNKHCAGIC